MQNFMRNVKAKFKSTLKAVYWKFVKAVKAYIIDK